MKKVIKFGIMYFISFVIAFPFIFLANVVQGWWINLGIVFGFWLGIISVSFWDVVLEERRKGRNKE